MIVSNMLDTIINIEIFAFIGLLVWLYFKQFDTDDGDSPDP